MLGSSIQSVGYNVYAGKRRNRTKTEEFDETCLSHHPMVQENQDSIAQRSDEIQGRFSVTFAAQPEVYLLR